MSRPIRYFAILAAMRTGSNLLERTLNQYADLHCHGELFNPAFVAKANAMEYLGVTLAEREANPEGLIARVVAEDPKVIPGFRIFAGHDPRILKKVLTDPSCARIWLTRAPLDSFVSLKIARETDQWMIGNEKKRKPARVHFDPAEFEAYAEELAAFQDRVRRMMAAAGQTALTLAYEDLKDVEVMNGAAAHLGSRMTLDKLAEPIKKQNPGTLRDKISNFEEVEPALVARGGSLATARAREPDREGGVKGWTACRSVPLLFAPIPSGPHAAVLRWMASLEGADADDADLDPAELLETELNRRAVDRWAAERPGALTFTALRHPLSRAYEAFCRRILVPGEDAFPHIRATLAETYGLRLPSEEAAAAGRAGMEDAGFGAGEIGAAFAEFLRFLEKNLTERTTVRTDVAWASQSAIIAGYNAIRPLGLIAREDRLARAGTSIRALLDLRSVRNAPLKNWRPVHDFPLAEVATPLHQSLAREAYPRDFADFGFADWVPGE
ncbi:MAG: nodulation protein NodH [Pseudomonadota bacterium]